MTDAARKSAAQVARASYGKLLATLSASTGDIALAEDALAEAFARALETWPDSGVPDRPEAWLLTAARNKMRDRFKSAAHRTRASLDDVASELTTMESHDASALPDRRLELLFVCAHPAIDEKIRTPLMLQTVLGIEATQIAPAFLVPSAAMAQRLVRAKRKIKAARIPFTVPGEKERPARLSAVLEAVYGAYAIASDDADESLTLEAVFLADLLVELLPDEAEVLGLASLLNYVVSRHAVDGPFVPLAERDPATWNRFRADRGDNLLRRAQVRGQLGRFQLEAAISAVHSDRRKTGETDWNAIVMLYRGLLHIAPTIGAAVAHAAAVGMRDGPQAGLTLLDRISPKATARHQSAWATRAHLLAQSGAPEAVAAYDKALELTRSARVREYLISARDRVEGP